MRKLAVLLFLAAAACPSAQSRTPSPAVGASSARGAVEGFLDAVRAQDLQRMSSFWGSEQGLVRDRIDRTDLERRELIIACNLAHDRLRIVDEAPRPNDRRMFRVELRYGQQTAMVDFTTVMGAGGRWFVEDAPPNAQTQKICAARSQNVPR